jgi:hypothetical protein
MKALTITTIQHFQLEPTPKLGSQVFSKLCKWRSAKLYLKNRFDNLDNGTQQAF